MHYKDIRELTDNCFHLVKGSFRASHVKMEHFSQRWQYEIQRWSGSSLRENVRLVSVFVDEKVYCWKFDLYCLWLRMRIFIFIICSRNICKPYSDKMKNAQKYVLDIMTIIQCLLDFLKLKLACKAYVGMYHSHKVYIWQNDEKSVILKRKTWCAFILSSYRIIIWNYVCLPLQLQVFQGICLTALNMQRLKFLTIPICKIAESLLD